jgi:hypothetical protein
MARIKVSRPAIIDTPASFTDLTATGDLTILGSASFSGSFTFSGSFDGGNATFNNITASGNISASSTGSFAHVQLPGQGKIAFDNTSPSDQFITGYDDLIQIDADQNLDLLARTHIKHNTPLVISRTNGTVYNFTGSMNITSSTPGSLNASLNVEGPITSSILKANTSTQLTLSSSFSTTLNFSINRIMITHSVQPLTMSIDSDLAVLGNVIMTDISASGLDLPSSDFKVLNGTFDTTKRNYVYYHYIGNDTALVTINQES